MGDRRVSDRRSPEKGVIKVPFKEAVIYLIFATLIIISVSANIVLARYYLEYKAGYEELNEMYIRESNEEETDYAEEADYEEEATEIESDSIIEETE